MTLLFVYLEKIEVYSILIDTPFPTLLDEADEQRLISERSLHPAIERVRDVAKNYWKM